MIKILFLAANPLNTTSIQLDEEIRAIEEALRMADLRDKFQIDKHFAVRAKDLQSFLQRCRPDIVHFAGHGSEHGEILLNDEGGQAHPVSAEALSELFRILKNNIRCVVLNACYADWQARAIAIHIDVVVGMGQGIEDKTARTFATGFYESLGNGNSIRKAFELGKNRISLENLRGAEVPQLLDRHGKADEPIFISPTTTEDTDAAPSDEPPYKGLYFYDEKDANRFFGREQWIAELVGHLRDGHRFLAIIGASGSGKSSLVRAGLVPALKNASLLADGTLPPKGSERWRYHILTPTAYPLEELATTLVPISESKQAISRLVDDMVAEPHSLRRHIRQLSSQRSEGDHLLLVIDEFEEVFTLCKDRNEQRIFINNLLTAAVENSATTVVIALRADFYHRCLEYDNLRTAIDRNQRLIGAMSESELRAAIEKSAQFGKWELEPGLIDLLIEDAANQPGALPLLSHALLETWKQRHGRVLTIRGYRASGGIRKAIAKSAEDLFKYATPEQQQIIKSIFLRLTELGEGSEDTRRRMERSELVYAEADSQAIDVVLTKLAKERLIIVDKDEVEVAHEALIREWPRLDKWLEEDREGLRIHRRLTEAAVTWKEMNCNPHDLYRGTRLDQALEWRANHPHDLNKTEQEFLDASLAERQRLIEEKTRIEQERADAQQRELMQARRVRNGAWAAFAATAIALTLAVIIGLQLYDENRKAQVEHLLVEFRELKAALQPYDAIEKLKAAERAANRINVNLGIDMHSEINDVVRHVAIQWVQQGEKFTAEGSLVEAAVKFRNILALNPPPDIPVYVWIEPGSFIMGTLEDDQKYDGEKPQHDVYLKGYWILRTEMTHQLYLRCIHEGPCTEPRSTHWNNPQFANWPVNGVDWEQANAYAKWVGGRLPTEAEWEKACRGTDGRIYPWGNDTPSPKLLNYQQSDVYEIASIGSYSVGANGLYDMAGNVYEWTGSIYRPYPYKTDDRYERFPSNISWVYRGGSFSSSELNVRCAFRNQTKPSVIDNSIGFRVVLPGP